MKSLKDLMGEMGFNPNAPEQTGEAFLRHLIAATSGEQPKKPTAKAEKEVQKPVQLEFDLSSDKQVS